MTLDQMHDLDGYDQNEDSLVGFLSFCGFGC